MEYMILIPVNESYSSELGNCFDVFNDREEAFGHFHTFAHIPELEVFVDDLLEMLDEHRDKRLMNTLKELIE